MLIEYTCEDGSRTLALWPSMALLHGETCGQCHYQILGAQVAREMIEAGEFEDVVSKWATEHKRRWEKSKFVKLWKKERKAGRDPRKAFEERGWEP